MTAICEIEEEVIEMGSCNYSYLQMKPTVKVFPETVVAYQRGDFKKMQQKTVTVRLSDEVVEYFKKVSSDWQNSIDAVLKAYIAQH